MRVVYAAYRHDPRDPRSGRPADVRFARALLDQGFDVSFAGPAGGRTAAWERLLRRVYRRWTGQRYAKFTVSRSRRASRLLEIEVARARPDVVFTIFPPCLAYYRRAAPTVYRLDTCYRGWHEQYPEFGGWALRYLLWQERQAVVRSAAVITHSAWTRNLLREQYPLPRDAVTVMPNPAALPARAVPEAIDIAATKGDGPPFRLLLVGTDRHRKGVDVAVETLAELADRGVDCRLTICGLDGDRSGEANERVRYAGRLRQHVPEELDRLVALYRGAHLLLHPARFDPAPIVVSEAAALATPTVASDVGGLASSVCDGVTGVILPSASPPSAYAAAIGELLADRPRYLEMCAAARRRYETDLNWVVAGRRVGEVLRAAARSRPG